MTGFFLVSIQYNDRGSCEGIIHKFGITTLVFGELCWKSQFYFCSGATYNLTQERRTQCSRSL